MDNFSTDHVQIGTVTDGDDGGTATSYYVLEDHVAMVDGQTHLDASDQVHGKIFLFKAISKVGNKIADCLPDSRGIIATCKSQTLWNESSRLFLVII